jgi:hypothetical protein
MRARAGDHIILAGEQVDQPTRAGEVLECGPDGGPPYTVRWEDGHTSTMYPGPGAVLRVTEAGEREFTDVVARPELGTMREWTVRVTLFEQEDDTTATVALLADSPEALPAARATAPTRTPRARTSVTRSPWPARCAGSRTGCSRTPSTTSSPPPASTTSRSALADATPGARHASACMRLGG